MKVRDEAAWSQQEQVLQDQGEIGTMFRDIVVFWCETSETMMEQAVMTAGREMSAIEAVRLSLQITEQQFGDIQVPYLGQMMLMMSGHWVHGEAMANNLTNIELKLFTDAVQLKQAELAKSAQFADVIDHEEGTPTQ